MRAEKPRDQDEEFFEGKVCWVYVYKTIELKKCIIDLSRSTTELTKTAINRL